MDRGLVIFYTRASLVSAMLEDHSRCVYISMDCGSYEMRFIVWNVRSRFNTLGKVQPDWWEDGLVKYPLWALDAAAFERKRARI